MRENPTLKKLEMREIALKENFYVEASGGMINLWYDDVTFDGHTDFLTNYPNLEELYLDGNQLTDIQFASSLKKLTHLGLNNNYVTELSPLNQLESLEYLDIRSNPINSTIETDGTVQIIR
ncbi:MAG: leucine-rich repeat domain-containing protein [Hungatella sp.]|nr:leucine-rich repeat domain-containing protein [Hungatella sp.]